MKYENRVDERSIVRSGLERWRVQAPDHGIGRAIAQRPSTGEHDHFTSLIEQDHKVKAGANLSYSIDRDDFLVTVTIQADSIAGALLFVSISTSSILLCAVPNERESHHGNDPAANDLLHIIPIPTDIDPEHARVSLLHQELKLVLPVATPLHHSLNAS
jgi:hypothetical protein